MLTDCDMPWYETAWDLCRGFCHIYVSYQKERLDREIKLAVIAGQRPDVTVLYQTLAEFAEIAEIVENCWSDNVTIRPDTSGFHTFHWLWIV